MSVLVSDDPIGGNAGTLMGTRVREIDSRKIGSTEFVNITPGINAIS